jgi:hypothetical protein
MEVFLTKIPVPQMVNAVVRQQICVPVTVDGTSRTYLVIRHLISYQSLKFEFASFKKRNTVVDVTRYVLNSKPN